jgi:hypothetical protein
MAGSDADAATAECARWQEGEGEARKALQSTDFVPIAAPVGN